MFWGSKKLERERVETNCHSRGWRLRFRTSVFVVQLRLVKESSKAPVAKLYDVGTKGMFLDIRFTIGCLPELSHIFTMRLSWCKIYYDS